MAVGKMYFAIRESLAHAPGDILGDGAGFFLTQAAHNADQQFSAAVEGVNVFLLEEAFYAMLFQCTDGGQGIDRVSGEAGNAFCYNQVDFTCQGVGDHLLEAFAFADARP